MDEEIKLKDSEGDAVFIDVEWRDRDERVEYYNSHLGVVVKRKGSEFGFDDSEVGLVWWFI